MRQEALFHNRGTNRNQQQPGFTARSPLPAGFMNGLSRVLSTTPRHTIVGALLITALLAFELFNFDTTQYALVNLMGNTSFLNIRWATILAVAFCAIDFAGLTYIFGPDRSSQNQREIWYLMGAWLLGATMNALMTWWAVSLTLLDHQNGNVILSHEQLLDIVPTLVAVLVWVTRILFIGAFSIAGSRLYGLDNDTAQVSRQSPRKGHRTPTPGQAPANSSGNRRPTAEGPVYGHGETRIPATQAMGAKSRPKSATYSTRTSHRSPHHVDRQRSPMFSRSRNSINR